MAPEEPLSGQPPSKARAAAAKVGSSRQRLPRAIAAGRKPKARSSPSAPALSYAAAGVDIDAGEQAVEAIADLVAATARGTGALGGIGGFGGLYELPAGYRRPVLVASTDGVGTKMAVATATRRFETVGIDLVAMCVDDLVCCGARPLFFLDYQLLGKVEPAQVRALVKGIAEGCKKAGCAIVGGELAEHPGLLEPGEVDLAGFAVGIVERDQIVDGPARAVEGDVLVGLPSPGLRANGYSLARAALAGRPLEGPAWPGADHSLADELLRPSVIYAPAVLGLLEALGSAVHAIAHITGGGLPGNIRRVLPSGLDAVLETGRWEVPRVFKEVQESGGVDDAEMARVFNLGIGMVLAIDPGASEEAIGILRSEGHEALEVGRLQAGRRQVHLVG